MAVTRVKVHQLTDGIDGELITWDASGVPATVAVGTAGHVLTSNGVGAAPTFQAATTGGDGIYGGSDTIFANAVATITTNSTFTFDWSNSNYAYYMNDDPDGRGLYLASRDHKQKMNFLDVGITIQSDIHSTDVPTGILIASPDAVAANQTTGDLNFIYTQGEFIPSSGTSTYTELRLNPLINQTGGASGASIGLNIAPTLTAVGSGGFTGLKIASTGQTALHTTSGLVKFDLGSDANYDIWYRGTNGALTRLPIGATSGHVLTTNGTGAAPSWQAASGGSLTANNGINIDATVIQLGGALTEVSTITGDTTNYLTVTGARTTSTNGSLHVNNTGASGSAIRATASGSGSALYGDTSTGTAVYGASTSGPGLGSYTTGNVGAYSQIEAAATGTVLTTLRLDRLTSGTAGNGIGSKILFTNETDTTPSVEANSIVSKWSTAAHASRLAEFSITGYNIGVENTLLTLSGTGAARLNKYGVNTFTGTAAYALQVDASGNIIEGSLSGGTPTTIEVTNDNLTEATVYPVWTTGASSSQALKISNTKISFAPSTGVLTTSTFVGNLTGNASGTAANVTGTVAIANGGTGQTTAANAINALVPTQTGNSGKYLTTNGTVVSWATVAGGIADADYGDITVSGTGTVMTIDNLAVTNAKINDVSLAKLTNGTLPAALTGTLASTGTFTLNYSDASNGFTFDDSTGSVELRSGDSSNTINVSDAGIQLADGTNVMLYVGGELRLYDSDATHYIGIKTPATGNLTTSYSLTLPQNDGTASGQVLTTDGAGVLSWTTLTATGDVVGPASANDSEIVLFNTASGKLVKAATGTGIVTATAGVYGTVTAPAGTVVGNTDAQTLTNKRIDPRVAAETGTFTPDVSTTDMVVVTGLAATCTINAPTGTPVQGTKLMFRIKDNGTTRSLTWNSIYRACGVPLPTATVVSKTMYVGMIYNTTDTKWDVVSLTQEA